MVFLSKKRVVDKYGCSFVAKLSWKNIFKKTFVFFTKYTLFAEKNVYIGKKWKKCLYWNIFLLKKLFLQRKI